MDEASHKPVQLYLVADDCSTAKPGAALGVLLPTLYAQDAELPKFTFHTLIGRDEFTHGGKFTIPARDLNKKGNPRIECGRCGEVPFTGSINCKCGTKVKNFPDVHKDQFWNDSNDQMQSLRAISWRPVGSLAQTACKANAHCNRAVKY